MSFIYKNNKQLIIELKKFMIENDFSQKQLAEELKIMPQALTKLFSKKNFSFEDVKKILNVMDYDLSIKFTKK